MIRYRTFLLTLVAAVGLLVGPNKALTQSGGGNLSGDVMGGAALIFRKPADPSVQVGGGTAREGATGSRVSGRTRTRPPVSTQDRIIAKANAARSAPTPRYSEAEDQYRLAAKQEPDDARAHAGLGNVYLDQGRFASAVESYQQAIKVKPEYLDAYQPLAYSLVRLERYADAIDIFNQGLKYDPNNAELYNNMAFAYSHAERYHESVAASQKAIELLGKTGEAFRQGLQNRSQVLSHAYKNLGNAYNGLKQYNEAADALKHAAELEPTNAAAQFNLGLALYNGKRYSEAIEAYKAVIKLRPQLAAAYYNLGLTYVAINDKESARAQYDILKPLNPSMANQLQSLLKR